MALEDYLNQIAQNIGFSPRDRGLTDSFYGLNIIGRGAPVPLNTENQGFTFFTKPDLNLSYDNLQVDRVMSNLLMENDNGIQRAVRSYLDPTAHRDGLSCPNVDPLNPFIPLLSNNLLTITGWEDLTLGTHTSNPGLYREAWSYVDDVPYHYGTYDLQCSFRNLVGDPITFMMLMWERYSSLVYEGRFMPYPENVLLNSIDYNTRIYRMTTDATRTYVTRIFACGAAFPMTAALAQHADYQANWTSSNDTPFATVNDQITFTFRAMGFTYYDHILIYEFNQLVQDFNPSMRDDQRESVMHELASSEREYFNYKAYPRINPMTMKLEWWMPKEAYTAAKDGVIRQTTPTPATTAANGS